LWPFFQTVVRGPISSIHITYCQQSFVDTDFQLQLYPLYTEDFQPGMATAQASPGSFVALGAEVVNRETNVVHCVACIKFHGLNNKANL